MKNKVVKFERVLGYLLKNNKGKFLNDKFNWTDFNKRSIQFNTLKECEEIKSTRPTAKVIEVVGKYTVEVGYGVTSFERIERDIKK